MRLDFANRQREAWKGGRYRHYYGIDIDDLSIYDLILDSTTTPPPELVEAILRAAGPGPLGCPVPNTRK